MTGACVRVLYIRYIRHALFVPTRQIGCILATFQYILLYQLVACMHRPGVGRTPDRFTNIVFAARYSALGIHSAEMAPRV